MESSLTPAEIEARVRQLETQVQRLRRRLFMLVAILLAGMLVPVAQFLRQQPPPQISRDDSARSDRSSTRDLRLVDDLGRTRVALRVKNRVPGVYFYGPDGAERMSLTETGLLARGRDGSVQAHLGIFPGGTPGLALGGDNVSAQITLRANAEGPMLALSDSTSTPRVLLRHQASETGFHLFDADGNERLGLAVSAPNTQLRMSDSGAHVRVLLEDGPSAGSRISFFDSHGDARASLGLDLFEQVVLDTVISTAGENL